jgi:hypothetical protein
MAKEISTTKKLSFVQKALRRNSAENKSDQKQNKEQINN